MSRGEEPRAQHEGSGLVGRFMNRLVSVPEPSREIIPKRWRMPFFVGLIVVSLLLLLLIIAFVVVPGIRSMHTVLAFPVRNGIGVALAGRTTL